MPHVTLRDIAKKAKVSHVTVSLALRNQPKIPEKTRERIKRLAKEMGYVPDPALGRLSQYRKSLAGTRAQSAIALINVWTDPDALWNNPTFKQYREGALERAEELGYRLEEFRLHESNMSIGRIESILRSRSITGLIIPPAQGAAATRIDMSWEKYTTVRLGFSMVDVPGHVVTNAQFETANTAVQVVEERGYKRIGYYTNCLKERMWANKFIGGYQARYLNRKGRIPIPVSCPGMADSEEQKRAFLTWVEKYKPEVVLSDESSIYQTLVDAGYSVPDDIGVVNLALPQPGPVQFSGIDQQSHLIGRQAVDLLARLIRNGEIGVSASPLQVLIEGVWVDGETA